MKNKRIGIVILITLGMIFAVSTISNNNISDDQTNDGNDINIQDNTEIKSPKKSAIYPESFIHIDGSIPDNWSDTVTDNLWCSGDGSWGNPYIIENVTINAGSSGSGIFVNNSKNVYFIIRNCKVSYAGSGAWESGIKLENTNNGTLTNNNCSCNGRYGILLRNNCDNNTISGNIASNIGYNNQMYGIYLIEYCDNNTISGNTANGNLFNGITLFTDCDDNIISGNTASNTTYNQNKGIYLYNSDNNTISGNNANDNQFEGIYLYTNCNENTISGNTASNDFTSIQNDGIKLKSNCDNNIISGNLMKNNLQYGIFIDDADCGNNTIYQNSLKGNGGWHARDDGTDNQWNNSIIGNYWDNHTTPDSDKDGIVDDPYTWIAGSADSEDSFPLIKSPLLLDGEKIHIDDSGVSSLYWNSTAKIMPWCTGTGTISDPYTIDGLEIDGGGSGNGILIGNSSAFFNITNCKVTNEGSGEYDAGIKLENTNNGALTNNNCSNNGYNGIFLYNDCDNNTISGNIANNNDWYGIYLREQCDNNTISGNTAINVGIQHQDYGIHLREQCDNNTISGNSANNNANKGIYLNNDCDCNTISGNSASNVGPQTQDYGIHIYLGSDNNTISGNTANNNTFAGINLNNDCNYNTISGNTASNVGTIVQDYGLSIYDNSNQNNITDNYFYSNINCGLFIGVNSNQNNITDNYFYSNIIWAIDIDTADCDSNIIKRNIIVGTYGDNFIDDDGINTLKLYNYFGLNPPSFVVEVIAQSFSTTEFIVTINISSQYLDFKISSLSIQVWWNGDPVDSNNITDIGSGLYNISLTPELVGPGEAPILLNMTISEAHHSDKYYELELAVDPEAVDKGPGPSLSGGAGGDGGGGGGDDDDDVGTTVVVIAVVVIASVGAGAAVVIILIKKGIIIISKSP